MSKDCDETVTSRRAYEYEEDGRRAGRWRSVAPNRLGSETVFPFTHAGDKSPCAQNRLTSGWMVSYTETGLEEINGDLLQTDFWPGIISGVARREAKPRFSIEPRSPEVLVRL
jgi:hypothetical protein